MKILIDFLPVALFFISYKFYGIYIAIYVMIATVFLQMFWHRLKHGRYEKMHIIALAMIIIFGGLTLWFKDPEFVMWKVSIINLIFALIIISSLWIGKRPLIERILGKHIDLPSKIWQRISWLWGGMFTLIAIVNAYYTLEALRLRTKLIDSDSVYGTGALDLQLLVCKNELCQMAQQAENAWVNFKLFGAIGITIVFMIITAIYISRYHKN